MSQTFTITNETKGRLPSLPFVEMKEKILGANYELSLVFCSSRKIQDLNKKYRALDQATDILSFPLSKTTGEIFICPSETKKMMVKFDRSYKNFLAFLLIHGLVHLKGFDHGSKMEALEKKFRQDFEI